MIFSDFMLVMLLASDMLLVTSSRLKHCIQIVAFQGLMLGILPLIAVEGEIRADAYFIAAVNIAMKCLALPYLLSRSIKKVGVKRDIEPFIGYSESLVIMLVASTAAFWLCSRLPMPASTLSPLAAPVALSMMGAGLFMVIARRKAVTQTIGFLAFENGIGAFGLGMGLENDLIVELGILLDVFVLVFVIGITLFHIRREFEHIDSTKLNAPSDWTPDINGTQEAEE